MIIDVRCKGIEDSVAGFLKTGIEALVGRLRERDGGIAQTVPVRLQLVDDMASAVATAGFPAPAPPATQVVGGKEGATLLVDGRLAAAAFAGDGKDLARLAHRIHLDLWQIEEAVGRAGPGVAPANALEQHLAPVVEGLWAEYAAARRAAWTLPADADLMLPHLVELFEALPPATTGDASLALAGGDLEDLFRRSLGRVTHLMQVVGHVHGCLAGIGAPIENLSPALAGRVSQSFLGSRWGATGRVLAALFGSVGQWDAAFLQQTLRPEVEAAFTGLGLTLRPTDDGGLWLEPRAMPASPPGHA